MIKSTPHDTAQKCHLCPSVTAGHQRNRISSNQFFENVIAPQSGSPLLLPKLVARPRDHHHQQEETKTGRPHRRRLSSSLTVTFVLYFLTTTTTADGSPAFLPFLSTDYRSSSMSRSSSWCDHKFWHTRPLREIRVWTSWGTTRLFGGELNSGSLSD